MAFTCGRCATNKYFQIIGNIHDIESFSGIDNTSSLNVQIFFCHWGHLAIIFVWVSRNIFHIGWNPNYELWILNPKATISIAHGIWDPAYLAYGKGDYTIVLSSGIYNWLYTVGFNSVARLYNSLVICDTLAVISIPLGKVHLIYNEELLHWLTLNKFVPTLKQIDALDIKLHPLTWPVFDLTKWVTQMPNLRLNLHTGIITGFFSIAWCGHLVDYAIPISRGIIVHWLKLNTIPLNSKWLMLLYYPFYTNSFSNDKNNHIFRSTVAAGQAILTFSSGLKSNTISLHLTDIAHHHLAVGILFVWAGHLSSSGLQQMQAHKIRNLFVNGSPRSMIRPLALSLQLQLSLALAGCCLITSVLASQMYSLTPYLYLSYDYITTVALYLHHSWIASFLMMGTFAHAALFLIRDYDSAAIGRILSHKGAIISHLSWICLWLGFHTLGVYIHNDTASAFCEQEKQILIEPVFAQIAMAVKYSTNVGASDLLAHHAIALGLHITFIILLKGCLDAPGSKLMPDKIHFGYGFACDGPGRGGTCDISAWDSFYLATFWMVNTGGWITFYFHWKHLTLWFNSTSAFDEASTYLNGWFRDYLWFNSTPLIHGYNTFGANDLSVWAWLFLAAHLCWASGFMFLISWRGYWQELIDIILYMHLKTPILYNLWNGDIYTPVALSIVQARFVGLVHFSAGFILTYTAFIIGATS